MDFFSELIAIRVSKISIVFLNKLVILGGNSEILRIGRNEGPDKRCDTSLTRCTTVSSSSSREGERERKREFPARWTASRRGDGRPLRIACARRRDGEARGELFTASASRDMPEISRV